MSLFLVWFAAAQITDSASLSPTIQPSLNISAAAVAIIIMLILIILVIINGIRPESRIFRFPLISQPYPPSYFIYQLVFIMIPSFAYTHSIIAYILLGTTVVSIIALVILKPYPLAIHNAALIFNQFVVGCVLGCYIFKIATNSTTDN